MVARCAARVRVELAPVFEPGGDVTSSVFLIGDARAAGPADQVLAELGGVWFSFLSPKNVIRAIFGHSDEGNRIYARAGFGF